MYVHNTRFPCNQAIYLYPNGNELCSIADSYGKTWRPGGPGQPIRKVVIFWLECHITHLCCPKFHYKFTRFYFTFKMSSWLSNNLTGGLSSISNFTGQISSFTREMLTEGTEEVSGKICVFWFSW